MEFYPGVEINLLDLEIYKNKYSHIRESFISVQFSIYIVAIVPDCNGYKQLKPL
jgi:hypothetical protein